jgi:hypothetical protein
MKRIDSYQSAAEFRYPLHSLFEVREISDTPVPAGPQGIKIY